MSMKRFFLIVLFFLISTSVFAQKKVEAILSGLEVVPQVHTSATGVAKVWIESDTLYVRGEFSDLKDYYFASNIHYGAKGKNGNPLYALHPDLSEDHKSGAFTPEKNKFYVSDAIKDAFKNGNLYITVASNQHQRGEIRGQIDDY